MIARDTTTAHCQASNGCAARGERGSILILTAFSMMVLLGIAALSVDVSYMYDMRNQLHAAADAAAKTGAFEVYRNSGVTLTALEAFANQQVIAHGLTPSACGSTGVGDISVCVNHPPASGPFAGDNNYVEAIVSRKTSTFFGTVLGFADATPSARAVAGSSRAFNCVYILGPGTPTLTVGNGTSLTLDGCGLEVGGSLDLKSGASITADAVSVSAADCFGVANCTPDAPPPTDPLASLAAPSPAPAHTCTTPAAVNANLAIDVSMVDSYYCGMKIDNAVVTFSPGVYFIAGPITNRNGGSNVTLNGSGVMFYVAPGGSIDVGTSNHVAMQLSAPTSGPYTGILFYQDRSNSSAAIFSKNNGDSLTLSGALYFPAAALELKNNDGITVDCALIVARSVAFKNNTTLNDSCSAYGGSPLFTVSMAE